MENTGIKIVSYSISNEAYEKINEMSEKTELEKSSIINNLINIYGDKLITDYNQALKKANKLWINMNKK